MEKVNCVLTLANSHLGPRINKRRLTLATEALVAASLCPILAAGCLLHRTTLEIETGIVRHIRTVATVAAAMTITVWLCALAAVAVAAAEAVMLVAIL